MKICFFNRSYFPDTVATGQLLTELAEDLVRNFGCRVVVVTGPALRGKWTRQQRIRGWLPPEVARLLEEEPTRVGEFQYFRKLISSNKAYIDLGWAPRIPFEDAIRLTTGYYRHRTTSRP